MSLFAHYRGISSTVRRCIEKETGREFAAKIIDLGAESGDGSSTQMYEATRQEIAILRQVMGHPYISTCAIHITLFDLQISQFIHSSMCCFRFRLQLNYKMSLSQMPLSSLSLNCAEMVNCLII